MRRRIEIPRLLRVDDESLCDLSVLLTNHSFDLTRVLVGSGSGSVAGGIVSGLRAAGAEVDHRADLVGRFAQAETLSREPASSATLMIGVGGGKVIDTVKFAAAQADVSFISVPTAISHDGISSPVASLVMEDGHRRSHAAVMPEGIIVDTAVISSAPARTLRAGVGDLASNLTAILDWRLAQQAGSEPFDAYSAMISEGAARSVLELVSLEDRETHELLAKGLLMSGLAMAAAGTSRPCSGSEHLISHALDRALGPRAAMHGEQVALGSLIAAAAHRSPVLATLTAVFLRLGLPTQPSDLSISRDEMVAAVKAAPGTRPDRHTILSELELSDAAIDRLLDTAFAGPA